MSKVDNDNIGSTREFSEWLNERRQCDVSEVFHELVAMFAAARAEQHAEDVRLLRSRGHGDTDHCADWLEQHKP